MLLFSILLLGDASKNGSVHEQTSFPAILQRSSSRCWECESLASLALNLQCQTAEWSWGFCCWKPRCRECVLCLTRCVRGSFRTQETVSFATYLAFLSERCFGWTNLGPSYALFQNENKLVRPAPPPAQINTVLISQDTFQELQGTREGSDTSPFGL